MSEEQTTFKVTDRRLFNPDGSPRELSADEKTAAESAAVARMDAPASDTQVGANAPQSVNQPVAATVAAEAEATSPEEPAQASSAGEEDFTEADIPDAQDPASFVNFAMSIASNAASALGMMEHPVTGKREVDLELGKHWIDVLGMLQKKTSGNLAAPEAKILEGWLADLRMQYVSMTGPTAPKTARAYTGRDIIGGK
jgi:hypothetical protein